MEESEIVSNYAEMLIQIDKIAARLSQGVTNATATNVLSLHKTEVKEQIHQETPESDVIVNYLVTQYRKGYRATYLVTAWDMDQLTEPDDFRKLLKKIAAGLNRKFEEIMPEREQAVPGEWYEAKPGGGGRSYPIDDMNRRQAIKAKVAWEEAQQLEAEADLAKQSIMRSLEP